MRKIAASLVPAVAFAVFGEAQAACEWSFNWYCSGCAKIGARTTGTNGGFADRQSCESARANMQRTMDSRGGGVNTVACQSSGACYAPTPQGGVPAPSSTSGAAPGYSGSAPSDYDPGADARRQEEARQRQEQLRREQEARVEQERQDRVRRDRDDALSRLKGSAAAQAEAIRGGVSWDSGLKGLPSPRAVPIEDGDGPRNTPALQGKVNPSSRPARGVPPAPVAIVESCSRRVSCVIRTDQLVVWLQDKTWAARIWSNDTSHRAWLGDAFIFITFPLVVEASLPMESRALAGSADGAQGLAPARGIRSPDLYYDFPTIYRGDKPHIPSSVFRENPYTQPMPGVRTWYWPYADSTFIPRTPELDRELQWLLELGTQSK